MECSTPALPVHYQLPEFAQTHVHWVSDAIQPPQPLSSPSPSAFNLSQHQGLFQWVRFFASSGQSVGVSASASVLSMNIQGWFPLELTGWIFSQSKGIALTTSTFVNQMTSLLFNMLSRLVITFLPRSKHLLWLQSPATVILECKKIKSVTIFIVSPTICCEVMGQDAMIFVFWMLNFKPGFWLSSFTFNFILFLNFT